MSTRKKKPHDCRCGFPDVVYSGVVGHASDCPTLHRAHRQVTVKMDIRHRDGSITTVNVSKPWPGPGHAVRDR